MAREAGATVESVTIGEVPQRIAAFLRACNLGPEIRTGHDPFLKGLAWQQAPELAVSRGVADAATATGVSAAAAAASETGTLVFTSGPDNPTTVNFLPETHIAVIPASRIKATYEDAWDLVRRAHPPATLPRTVNFVTGPSRTADIEQTLLMGAHGPRRLHILVVADG
jgi:L-lactate dehydrogenase complex protein LldG